MHGHLNNKRITDQFVLLFRMHGIVLFTVGRLGPTRGGHKGSLQDRPLLAPARRRRRGEKCGETSTAFYKLTQLKNVYYCIYFHY